MSKKYTATRMGRQILLGAVCLLFFLTCVPTYLGGKTNNYLPPPRIFQSSLELPIIHDLVLDIGFNDGADTEQYLSQGYRVIAVEANPGLAQSALNHFSSELLGGRLTLLNVGISNNETGDMSFYVHKHNN